LSMLEENPEQNLEKHANGGMRKLHTNMIRKLSI